MAGHAQGQVAQDFARLLQRHVGLADMRAVAAELHREVGTVVEDERHVAALHDRAQLLHRAGDHIIGHVLQPQLQCGDIPGIECCGELRLEGLGQHGRGDEVKAAVGHGGESLQNANGGRKAPLKMDCFAYARNDG